MSSALDRFTGRDPGKVSITITCQSGRLCNLDTPALLVPLADNGSRGVKQSRSELAQVAGFALITSGRFCTDHRGQHAVPLGQPVKIIAGDYRDAEKSAIVVFAAGAASSDKAETRLELLERNEETLRDCIAKLKAEEFAGVSTGVLAISNRTGEVLLLVVDIGLDIRLLDCILDRGPDEAAPPLLL